MTTRFDDTAPSVDELNGALKEAARGYVTTDNGFSPEIDSILSRCARAGVVSAADKKEAHRLHQQLEDEQAVSECRDAGWGVGNQSQRQFSFLQVGTVWAASQFLEKVSDGKAMNRVCIAPEGKHASGYVEVSSPQVTRKSGEYVFGKQIIKMGPCHRRAKGCKVDINGARVDNFI